MTLRSKVLLAGSGLILAAMMLLGTVLILFQRNNYLEEVELRARTFLAVLSVESTPKLASNRIEDLDKFITRLTTRDLNLLDIDHVAVLDRDRRVLAHTNQHVYGRILDDGFTRDAARSRRGLVLRARVDGRELLQVSAPIRTEISGLPGIRWGTVVAGIRLDRIQGKMTILILEAVAMVIAMMLLAAFVTSALLNLQFVRPVQRLAQAAHEIASGHLETRAPAKRSDELGRLGSSFNEMAEKVERYTRGLEAEVKKRTVQLEDANSQLTEANVRLEELATTDGLTGLFNFRHFKQVLTLELRRSRRLEFPTSLVMIDVDHFKNYNDTHGHPAGDVVLKKVAEILQERLRNTDVPCRYGGEEFAIVLLDTENVQAVTVAEEIRRKVMETEFPGEEQQPGGVLTVSLGVATFPEDADGDEAVVQAADKALYRAKQAGRNRVINARDQA